MADRHSETDEPELILDPEEKALAEARNAIRQFDVGMVLLEHWLDTGQPYVRPSDLLTLNRFAIESVNKFAGTFRNTEIKITGSDHQPPASRYVPELVEDFCAYLNENWVKKDGFDLAAYSLWRINWIHPFADGNGRTARILCYIVLSAKLGFRLPGTLTIPEQIAADKQPYYEALEAADQAFLKGKIDVSAMRSLIENCLERQLESSLSDQDVEAADTATQDVFTEQERLEIASPAVESALLTQFGDRKPILPIVEHNPVLFGGIFNFVSALIGAVIGAALTLLLAR